MRKSRFSEEQIIQILAEGDAGASSAELSRRYGVSKNTYFRWKSKYGGMGVSEAKKLKSLEDENRRLKRLVADLSLDNAMLKDVLGRKW